MKKDDFFLCVSSVMDLFGLLFPHKMFLIMSLPSEFKNGDPKANNKNVKSQF